MRCKSCKKKIENENLYRCPHCGKPIVKKKRAEPKELLSIGSFIIISIIYVLFNFLGLFFKCDYYNPTSIVIGMVIYLVTFPFTLGNFKGMSRNTVSILGVLVSLPLIANWIIEFVKYPLARDALSTAYYFTVIGIYLITDILLILKAAGTLNKGEILKWIFFAMGVIGFLFTIVFYAITNEIKLFAILIIAVNAFIPSFVAYHITSRDSRGESLLDI